MYPATSPSVCHRSFTWMWAWYTYKSLLWSTDQIRALMDKPTNIRNMSVIAHGTFQIPPQPFHDFSHATLQSTTESPPAPTPWFPRPVSLLLRKRETCVSRILVMMKKSVVSPSSPPLSPCTSRSTRRMSVPSSRRLRVSQICPRSNISR